MANYDFSQLIRVKSDRLIALNLSVLFSHQCLLLSVKATKREVIMNASISCVDQTITLVGELSFNTVQRLQDLSKEISFPNDTQVVLDLGQVTKVDSSALALCLALEKRLVANKSTLAYINIPTALLGIAQSVGVQSLFSQ